VEPIRDLVVRAATASSEDDRINAYGHLVERFRDMACGYAYSILGDFHLAEDAAQDAFVIAYRTLNQLREPGAFPDWLRRIVWSACGRMRRQDRLSAVALDAAENVRSETSEPDQIVARKEMREQVLRAVRELPSLEREVTALFYINGYSQKDIAEFLKVPVNTIKSRLAAARSRLKERMLAMVKETLHQSAPDERFDKKVIARLLERPNLLEIENHPVRQIWNAIRAGFPEYQIVSGNEIEDMDTAKSAEDHAWAEHAYRPSEDEALRYQMTTVTITAIRGRTPPVRLLAAGRVFRPDREDSSHSKVFHQMDGICIQEGADVALFKATCERVLRVAVPEGTIRWRQHEYGFVVPGFVAVLTKGKQTQEILGGGMLREETLSASMFDPKALSGFAWGLGLERLAMLASGLDDIRVLWQSPYVKE